MEEIKVMRFDGHLTFTNVAVFKVGSEAWMNEWLGMAVHAWLC